MNLITVLVLIFGLSLRADTIDSKNYLPSPSASEVRERELINQLPIAEAHKHLSKFPNMKTIEIKDEAASRDLCNKGLSGYTYWWNCKTDLSGKLINQSVLDLAYQMAKTDEYQNIQSFLLAMRNVYVDSNAVEHVNDFVSPHWLPEVYKMWANRVIDKSVIRFCDSQYSVKQVGLHPVASAHVLNQIPQLQCLYVVRDLKTDASTWPAIQKCRLQSVLQARTVCLKDIVRSQIQK